jgi:centromeric protein E
LTETVVVSAEETERILRKGSSNRQTGETNMNESSSRSHTIFKMVIESRDLDDEGAVTVSCLNLVDLAGSERVRQTGAEGIRMREGNHINKSLLTLGTVIGKLSEGGDDKYELCLLTTSRHIPFRDSKLTQIMKASLGGNANTAIICTITPANAYSDDSISTLKFASRAKIIQNKPQVNKVFLNLLINRFCLIKPYLKSTSQR